MTVVKSGLGQELQGRNSERPDQRQKDEGFAGAAARVQRNSLCLSGFLILPSQVAAAEAMSYAAGGHTSAALATRSCRESSIWWPFTAPTPHIKSSLTSAHGPKRKHLEIEACSTLRDRAKYNRARGFLNVTYYLST